MNNNKLISEDKMPKNISKDGGMAALNDSNYNSNNSNNNIINNNNSNNNNSNNNNSNNNIINNNDSLILPININTNNSLNYSASKSRYD